MPPTATEQAAVWLDDRHLDYHRRQFVRPYRSTLRLGEFAARILGVRAQEPCAALDVGCGAGANIVHLSRALKGASWTGVDIAGHLFPIGSALIAEHGDGLVPVNLVAGDFYRLTDLFPRRSFDVVFSIQTVSWLPGYADFLEPFLAMVKPGGTAFVTSLFTDFRVEARIEITEFEDDGARREPMLYNVYCCDRFTECCRSLGAAEVIWEPFEMDVELPVPAHRRMGTYTRRSADGALWQYSGPLAMPWQFAAIRMKPQAD